MTKCTTKKIGFPGINSQRVEADFSGGEVTSDGGGLLLRQADKKINLLGRVAKVIPETRQLWKVDHSLLGMLRQRVYGIGLGYEDLNDHITLRNDLAFQTTVSRDESLASMSTLSRLENRMERTAAVEVHRIMLDTFLESFKKAPRELVLDFDATDDPVHGKQEGRFFHGFYNEYCFLPLYVFCGEKLLVSYLRPSNIDPAKHAWAIAALLVKAIRAKFPNVKIILRADSGFCRWKMLRWCERKNVHYCIGIARNSRLENLARPAMKVAAKNFKKTGEKQRVFSEIRYAAQTWDKERRIVIRAEHSALGKNPRFVVTNLEGVPQKLYDDLYCLRGEMENRIKEQLHLFSDRTSCHDWWANQFRLLLSSLAYILIESIRRLALQGTELARAQAGTIRLKLLKIGAVIVKNTRRIRFMLSSAYPYQDLFRRVAHRLAVT